LECIHASPRKIGPCGLEPAKLAPNNACNKRKWCISGVLSVLGVKNKTGAKTGKERPPDTCSMSLNSSRRVESTSQTAASTGHGTGRRLWREMYPYAKKRAFFACFFCSGAFFSPVRRS
jgi:hypothetical protein